MNRKIYSLNIEKNPSMSCRIIDGSAIVHRIKCIEYERLAHCQSTSATNFDEDELEEIIIDVVDMTIRVLMGLVVLQDLMRKIQKARFLSSKVEILIQDVGTTQIPINHK